MFRDEQAVRFFFLNTNVSVGFSSIALAGK